MRKQLIKSVKYGEIVDVMYVSNSGVISKRRIKVLQVNEVSFRAYCHLRKAKRTFRIDNVLALVPFYTKESLVI